MSRLFALESEPLRIDELQPAWHQARAAYFAATALRHRDAWQMHHDNGHFGVIEARVGDEVRELNLTGAVKHCMAEAARARVLGGMLGFDEPTVGQLEKAALLHDSYKGPEVKMMLERGPSWESYDDAQAAARESWERSGRFSTEVMDIAASVAHESLHDMEGILQLPKLTPFDTARLAMHYLDDFTVDSRWAMPANATGNDLDSRMIRNAQNERYHALNMAGRAHFGGRTTYEAQRDVGHQVEGRLAELITAETGWQFNPLDLPVIIDNQIKHDILGATAVEPSI